MKLAVDKDADALYLRLDDSAIVVSEQVSRGWCWTIMNRMKWWAWRYFTSPNAPPT